MNAFLHNDMAAFIRSALLPQRFPIRRDVELSAGVRSRDEVVSFYDHMWLGRHTGGCAVQIRGTGLETVLDAASFRQLEAALAVLDDPAAVLSACRDISAGRFRGGLVRFDTSSGAWRRRRAADVSRC